MKADISMIIINQWFLVMQMQFLLPKVRSKFMNVIQTSLMETVW